MLNKKFLVGVLMVLALATMACAGCDGNASVSQQTLDQNNNNSTAARLHKAVPYPFLTWSNELWNQAERYRRLNNPSEVGYVYVIAYNLVYGPYQVIGKCSSTESQYSAPSTVASANDVTGQQFNTDAPVTIPSAQPDGSYGQNEQAIFCFMDDSAKTMIEFSSSGGMGWIWTEKPLLGMPTVAGTGVVQNGH